MKPTPRVLIIAGSDSGGGAGIQADIKTVTMLGGHAMTAITAITAQNTLGVQGVHPVPTDMVIAQIESVVSDIGVDAIKIGMIGSAETAEALADYLHRSFRRKRASRVASAAPAVLDSRFRGNDGWGGVPIVFDPVMVATSGSILADADTINAFDKLMDLATLVTPNIPELAALGGEDVIRRHGCALLVKGGHADSDLLTDRLIAADGSEYVWQDIRIDTPHTHGTGCTLASAIASGLAAGQSLAAAVTQARLFVRLALRAAPGLGGGHGPMGHGAVRLDVGPDMRLNQVTLPCRDYDASVAFYRDLGFVQIVDAPSRYARFEAPGGATLSLHAVSEGGPDATFYLESADIDAAVAGLKLDEAPVDQAWGWREARITDPSGNRLCLYQAGEMRRFPPWRINA